MYACIITGWGKTLHFAGMKEKDAKENSSQLHK